MTGVEYICDCKHEVHVYKCIQLHPVKHHGCAQLPQQLGGLNIHMHMYSLKKPGECLQMCALSLLDKCKSFCRQFVCGLACNINFSRTN